ncbi:MAG: cytochrome P450 [Myxococcota bacterium]
MSPTSAISTPDFFTPAGAAFRPKLPIDLSRREFIDNANAYFDWLLEHEPVTPGRMSLMRGYLVSRYDDCLTVLKDKERITRSRRKARGKGGNGGYPVPGPLEHLVSSMVNTDDPEHRRLRNLVHRAFTPRALRRLETRIEALTDELLDAALAQGGTVDLIQAYCLPIPVTVISEMMGVSMQDMPLFVKGASFFSRGFNIPSILKLLLWDLPRLDRFVRRLIATKRETPGEDILSNLITAEIDGDRLSEDELVAMAFLLTLAGYETTVYLIANAVLMLLLHPKQRELAMSSRAHLEGAIEETQRFHGSVQGTEIQYASEDIELSGVVIPKGSAIFALIGAGNRDPRAFERPGVFDITRSPNKHLGFGHGIHYCVGAPLARMETRIALQRLFERAPQLELAVSPDALRLQPTVLMRRYESLPVRLRRQGRREL